MTDPASPVTSGSQVETALPKETAKETSLFWTLMTPVTFAGRMIKNVVVFTFFTAPSAILSVPGRVFSAAKSVLFGETKTTKEAAIPAGVAVEEELSQVESLPAEILEESVSDKSEPETPPVDQWTAKFERDGATIQSIAQEDTTFAALLAQYREAQPAATPTTSPRDPAQSATVANFIAPAVSPEEQAEIDAFERRGRQVATTTTAALNALELEVHPERFAAAPNLVNRFINWLREPVTLDDLH